MVEQGRLHLVQGTGRGGGGVEMVEQERLHLVQGTECSSGGGGGGGGGGSVEMVVQGSTRTATSRARSSEL